MGKFQTRLKNCMELGNSSKNSISRSTIFWFQIVCMCVIWSKVLLFAAASPSIPLPGLSNVLRLSNFKLGEYTPSAFHSFLCMPISFSSKDCIYLLSVCVFILKELSMNSLKFGKCKFVERIKRLPYSNTIAITLWWISFWPLFLCVLIMRKYCSNHCGIILELFF